MAALLTELADEAPNTAAFETVRADLRAASRAFEHGTKTDLALRLYQVIRSMFHELGHMNVTPTAEHEQHNPEAHHGGTFVP